MPDNSTGAGSPALGSIPVPLVLSIAAVTWYSILLSFGLIGWWNARRRYRVRPRSPLASASPSSVPGVTIIRPLKGLDTNLYENLESTFKQEYPNFEILLAIADAGDQAFSVARELVSKYPNVNARIIIGEQVVGVNPKVNNLMRPYREAANDILWVIDSNIMVDPGVLARSVDALVGPPNPTGHRKRRIAVVHHVPFATTSESLLGARMEEAFLNTNHAKMYIAINSLAIESCVVGKSNLFRRSDVERVNGSLKPIVSPNLTQPPEAGERGLAAFGRFLAEDNMLASALWHELGDRHDMSCDVARNTIGKMTFVDYLKRRARWIRVRKHMVFAATLVEPITESVVVGVLTAAALRYLLAVPPALFLAAHFLVWLLVDFDVYASLAGHPIPAAYRWSFVTAWALRELSALPIWAWAVFGSEVEWRGKRYQVLRNGEVKRAVSGKGWLGWMGKKGPDEYEPLSPA